MIDNDSLYALLDKRFVDIAKSCDQAGVVLRHDKKSIWASDIEEAYYCEKKLDYSYLLSEDEVLPDAIASLDHNLKEQCLNDLERKYIGSINHAAVMKPDCSEIRVLGIFNGIPIGGSIDELEVSGENITVVERKFRSLIPNRPYNEHEVQGRVYCYCLDYMLAGTFPYNLNYRIDYCDLNDAGDSEIKLWQYYQYNQRMKVHMHDELSFVAGYWTEKREAKAQKSSRAKCNDCVYNVICESSLVYEDN